MLENIEFEKTGIKQCSSLRVILRGAAFLGGPKSLALDHVYECGTIHITIDQLGKRTIHMYVDNSITMKKMWDVYSLIERLLMLFDGQFYFIESVEFVGNDCTKEEYSLYVQECLARRLVYYKTDKCFKGVEQELVKYDTVLTEDLILKWQKLQDQLDIIHQVFLYNIADTGITQDVKCANIIESLEPITEIINEYDKYFPNLHSKDQNPKLKLCIDAVISKFGKDVFAEEYNKKKDEFLQILVNTRNHIMHIKRFQPEGKILSGEESVLYLVKFSLLYRVVLLSLLDIDYAQYQGAVIEAVKKWNSLNGIFDKLMKTLGKNADKKAMRRN